ncbi:MAG: DNA-binding response regulator [Calditrichaeota bacterium]|nr:MAG: DNA-binding response regulator [Calditrichota bacterium]
MKRKILIVEDDESILFGLREALKREGYAFQEARDGEQGYHLVKSWHPDLILLDIMLPHMSGLELCKRLRDEKFAVPIIMLTARGAETDKVLGLELGADDYVTKPFGIRELLARIKAQLRRNDLAQREGTVDPGRKVSLGEVEIDLKRLEVKKRGEVQNLTNREFQLLVYFLRHPNEVLSRERLLNDIWGYNVYPTTRTVDNHVMRLRKHIESDPENPRYIKTVHGVGYLFEWTPERE